jgi:hypothetical protein
MRQSIASGERRSSNVYLINKLRLLILHNDDRYRGPEA